ncbi:MAG: hypothetical protein AABY15_06890 [Nanoarchaeota archaeon]
MELTINQALDKLTNIKNLNEEQQKLRDSLIKVKIEFGGKTIIENSLQVSNVIDFGNKEGK